MKKFIVLLVAFMSLSFLFTSCEKEEDFDETFLPGKWQLVGGTEIYKYLSNGTGAFWDPADDVTEAEGQAFTWTLVKSDLTHIHIMEIGGNVPKFYTVTELTATTLKYHDSFNVNFSYTKISK